MKLVWFPTWKCNNYKNNSCPYCPYGWNAEADSLTFKGEISSKEGYIKPEIIKEFFKTNYQEMEGKIEITGGEPLMYKPLAEVLDSHIKWAITSNTSIVSAVEKLINSGAIRRCFSWTASYHFFAHKDREFTQIISMLALNHIDVRVTVVVSEETLPHLKDIKSFLECLPIKGINWHMETHKGVPEEFRADAEKIIGPVDWVAGEIKVNSMCLKRSKLLALSPGGILYECVTHCYTNKDPICTITPDYELKELTPVMELCKDECFACSDWIKHT